MDRLGVRLVLSLLLIGAGVMLLLDNLDLITGDTAALIWAALSFVAGLAFLAIFFLDREAWWALIPGFVFLSLAILVGVAALLPEVPGDWLGALFLAGLGLGFWAVFLARRDFWWAIIPGGVLLTLALIAGLASVLPGELIVGILFLGLALTFGVVSLVPTPQGRMKWALIPAAILLLVGLIAATAAGGVLFVYLGSAALILAGVYLLVRFTLVRRRE